PLSYVDSGLTARTTYTYRAKGCNPSGCSNYSSVASATTPFHSAPQSDLAVRNLTVTPTSGPSNSITTVNFTIYNQGSGTANPSTTNIRLNTSSSSVTSSDALLASISIPT